MNLRRPKFFLLISVVLGGTSFLSFLTLDNLITAQKESGAQNNIAGSQRMLSQRMGLLAQRLIGEPDPARRKALRSSLAAAADMMERRHMGLIHGSPAMKLPSELSAESRAMYFGPARFVGPDLLDWMDNWK